MKSYEVGQYIHYRFGGEIYYDKILKIDPVLIWVEFTYRVYDSDNPKKGRRTVSPRNIVDVDIVESLAAL